MELQLEISCRSFQGHFGHNLFEWRAGGGSREWAGKGKICSEIEVIACASFGHLARVHIVNKDLGSN